MLKKLFHASYRTARRILIAVVGTTVFLTGVALLVLPGPAFLVIPAGLAILSLEFTFAKRWLRLARSQTEAALQRRNSRGLKTQSDNVGGETPKDNST